MAAIEPIDISSSDSDIEIEDDRGRNVDQVRGSGSSRVLPPWASRDGQSSRAGGQFQRVAFKSDGSSSTITKSLPAITRTPSSTNEIRLSSRAVDDPRRITDSGCIELPQTINSRIATNSSADYEKFSSQHALTRTLPSSFHVSQASKPVESIRTGQLRDNSRDSYHPTRPSSSNSNAGHVRDVLIRGNGDIFMHENNGSRVLPPTLLHGKSTSASHVGSSSDPMFRSGLGEERTSANDERLIYQAALEDLNQPKIEVDLPEGLLSVPLLRHQKIALAWMLQKETRSLHCLGGILADDQGLGKTISTIALIQMQKMLQKHSKPENSSHNKIEALNLDDDDDENGCVVLDKGKSVANKDGEAVDIKKMSGVSSSKGPLSKGRPDAGTLVVCPASVLRQWARELDEKVVNEAKLKVLLYHGGTRTKDPIMLADHDVVLTTYSIVTNEVPKQPLVDDDEGDERDGEKHGLSSELFFNKRKKTSNDGKKGKKSRKGDDSSSIDCDSGALAKVRWFRVVLDEAQTIKNHRTQVARACCSLRAKRRWCLSGTPIQNTIDDLYSYFRFLKYDPYATYKSFYHTIKVPISRNSLHGYKKLQAVLRAIMLRRTKETLIDGKPIVNLPPKTINLERVEFSTEERAFYSHLEAESRSQFKEYAAAGTLNQNYASILLMLLRLRQACDHPLLAQGVNSASAGRSSDSLGSDSLTMAKSLPREMLYNLLKLLERPICQDCSDTPEDPVVTMCGHTFCYQCVSEYLTGDENMCPATGCREQLGTDIVFSRATLRACISNNYDGIDANKPSADKSIVLRRDYISSKVKAVLEILQSVSSSDHAGSLKFYGDSPSRSDEPMKAIIFSQWTSMLDLVQNSLVQNDIECRRLDGTMTLASRDKAVREFNTYPEIRVMLMSLKAGNLGLNMVAACHVILLDLWWNPTTEDQAIDRAHRIGQTRPVTVTRLTIKNTVEDRILSLQEEKKKMVASAFGEDHGGGAGTRLTVEDLRYLFMV